MNEALTGVDRKTCNKKKQNKKTTTSLKTLIKTYKLMDVWRLLHTNSQQHTEKRRNSDTEASRIDYFLVSPELRTLIETSDIRPALISSTDHQAISLKINVNTSKKGKVFFLNK